MGDDGMVIALLQKLLEADLNGGLHGHSFPEFSFTPAVCQQFVFSIVFFHQGINICLGHCLNIFHGIVDIIMVDLPSEFDLGLNLVALCNRHIVHIVAHTADAQMAGLHHAHRCAHPAAQLLLQGRIGPMAHNNFAFDSHAAYDMSVFPVAVGRLVLIHEVHVNLIVRNFLIELCVQVAQRFSVLLQADDPHLGG